MNLILAFGTRSSSPERARLIPLIVSACALLSTGCATRYCLDAFDDRRKPEQVIAAKVEDGDRFHAMIQYRDRSSHVVRTALVRRGEPYPPGYAYLYAKLVEEEFGDVEGRVVPVVRPEEGSDSTTFVVDEIDRWQMFHVYQSGYDFRVRLGEPAPVSWTSPDPYLMGLYLPLFLAFDVATSPLQLIFRLTYPGPV